MEPGSRAQTSIFVVAKDHVKPAQYEGIIVVRMEKPLEVENGLEEPKPIRLKLST
jgi:hypothetical protein